MSKPVILCVDDTAQNLEVLVELLHEYEPVASLDPFNALSLLERIEVDMILLDVMMPQMDGFELCRRIKANPKFEATPLLFLTAKSDEESIEKGYELGAVDYVTKPFRPTELLSRVKTHLKLHALVNDLNAQVQESLKTQQKQEALLIKQSYAATMGQMIDIVAHQWMQPLNIINMRLGTLMLDYEDEKVDEEYLLHLQERGLYQIRHLVNTLNEFRSFMSPHKKRESFSILGVINKVLLLLKEKLEAERVTITIDAPSDFEINAIENEFIHVVINLIQNAIDAYDRHKQETRTIKITIDALARTLSVSDHAGGIAPQLLDSVFDLHVTQNGSGLGLYMCRMILEKYDARIEAKNSENTTVFTLRF